MSSISAGTTTGTALVSTGDTTGELVLKTNGGTTAMTIDTAQNVTFAGAGAIIAPSGTTAQRPASPVAGMLRFNTDDGSFEQYDGSAWGAIAGGSSVSIGGTSGEIYTGISTNIVITGLGFGTTATVRFSYLGTATDVSVTPDADDQITVAVPSAVYNQAAGTSVNLAVIKDGNITNVSGAKTIIGIPTGGTVTITGGYAYHTFTSSGTLTVPTGFSAAADYLLVAGGGGGGSTGAIQAGGGGGAGGYISGSTTLSSGSYSFTVGLGGSKGTSGTSFDGTNGGNTTGFSLTAVGGGGGGGAQDRSGLNGGSGGGRASGGGAGVGGTATSGQGNIGGGNGTQGTPFFSGGGGGAFSEGQDQFSSPASYNGGDGKAWLNGTYYAGGGGGGERASTGIGVGSGGLGGGGDGGEVGGTAALVGGINTGGGGGGGAGDASGENGANGGSGVVIVRYVFPS